MAVRPAVKGFSWANSEHTCLIRFLPNCENIHCSEGHTGCLKKFSTSLFKLENVAQGQNEISFKDLPILVQTTCTIKENGMCLGSQRDDMEKEESCTGSLITGYGNCKKSETQTIKC